MIKFIKRLSLLLLLSILVSSINMTKGIAEEKPNVRTKEVTVIIMSSYSIWKHSDGTWQNNEMPYPMKPGSQVKRDITIKYPYPDKDKVVGLKSVSFFKGDGLTFESDRELWNKYRWDDFDETFVPRYFPVSVKSATYSALYSGNGEAALHEEYYLVANSGVSGAEPCKEPWQSETVEGWKYYIPRVEVWLVEEEVPTDDYRFTFSTFSNNEINQNNPKYDFTFYIADFENRGVEEKFYVDLWHHSESDWKNEKHKSFTLSLNAGKAIDWYKYEMSATPVWAIIYRKDKEWERWKDNENMHENFWNGYTKVINGETYYYYNTYYYSSDGMRFVSANDLINVPLGNKTEWLNYLGFSDVSTMQNAIED